MMFNRQSESIHFGNHEKYFTMLLGPKREFNFSFIKLVYIW